MEQRHREKNGVEHIIRKPSAFDYEVVRVGGERIWPNKETKDMDKLIKTGFGPGPSPNDKRPRLRFTRRKKK